MFHICLYYTVLSFPCSLVITCWERSDILVLLCVIFPCVFVTFQYDVSVHVWYLIVFIPDLCLLLYFRTTSFDFFLVLYIPVESYDHAGMVSSDNLQNFLNPTSFDKICKENFPFIMTKICEHMDNHWSMSESMIRYFKHN